MENFNENTGVIEIDLENNPIDMEFFSNRLEELKKINANVIYHIKNAIFYFFDKKIFFTENLKINNKKIFQTKYGNNVIFEDCNFIFFGYEYFNSFLLSFDKYFLLNQNKFSFINPIKKEVLKEDIEFLNSYIEKIKKLNNFDYFNHLKYINDIHLTISNLIIENQVSYFIPQKYIYKLNNNIFDMLNIMFLNDESYIIDKILNSNLIIINKNYLIKNPNNMIELFDMRKLIMKENDNEETEKYIKDNIENDNELIIEFIEQMSDKFIIHNDINSIF